MTKEEFLDTYIFKGLQNINDGFDVVTIKYFSEEDFSIILDRIEKYGLEIYGIEPWKEGEYYDCKTWELYGQDNSSPADPMWYRTAFGTFIDRGEKLQYSGTYGIDEKLLKDIYHPKSMSSEICKSCVYVNWMVGIGQGVRCGHIQNQHYKQVNNELSVSINSIPSPCEYYELK